MRVVAAAFLGTLVACMLFLFGVDRVFCGPKKSPPATMIDAPGFLRVWEQNAELRQERYKLVGVIADLEVRVTKAEGIADAQRERATVAESRLANCEQRLVTAAVLADAERRAVIAVPRLGDEPGDLIPPVDVPLVPLR
jgi:hypothetical protein